MTETNGLGTSLRLDGTYTHPDSIGRPSATVQVEIRDPDTHAALPDGQVGEIAMRSGATFLGYWRNPEATAKALDADRWYHTGDFGHVRDGFVYLEGRRQDLIIRGGENIYPVEIENRLIEHPAVAEVAVVGRHPCHAGPGGGGLCGREGPRHPDRGRHPGLVLGHLGRLQGSHPGGVRPRTSPQRVRQGAQAPARLRPSAQRLRTGVIQHGL